jgi:endonuclease-3
MDSNTIRKIFLRFHHANPSPATELIYHSYFELLIAVILSAQATDVSVNKATSKLFVVANTPEKILALGEEKLKTFIKTIGLFNSKAAHIIKTCEILVEKHQSCVPQERAALEALPGVGRKTANVILNTCFGQPMIAVDTHIFRVANRIGLTQEKTPLAVEKKLLKIIPSEFLKEAHHWLVLHGRYTCTARKPHCATCLINDLCLFPDKEILTLSRNRSSLLE